MVFAVVARKMKEACNHVLFIHVGNDRAGKLSSIPISEAYMIAYIKKEGFTASLVRDHTDQPLTKESLRRELQEKRPMLVGFTCYDVTIDRVRIWARYVRKLDPGIKIVLGGPQIQFMPGNALDHMPEIDFLCRGEGEIVLMNLCRALSGNDKIEEIEGICFRKGNVSCETARPPVPETLEGYPSPYLDETIDPSALKKAILLTSRGCNWDCHFCYTPNATARRVRYHSVDQVVREMKFLKQKGVGYFWFADPLFSANPLRLKDLLNRIICEVSGIQFWCECRCEVMNEEIFQLLKAAGAVKIAFGLESGSAKVLKIMNKRLDLNKLSCAVRLAQNVGIEVELFSIFGLPGETFTDAMETIDYVKRHGVRITGNSGSQKMSIYFGTEFQWNSDRYGIIPIGVTKPSYKSIGRDYKTNLLSSEDLTRISSVWRLQEMVNTPPEEVVYSLNQVLKHKNLLHDQAVFHYVLFKAYLMLQEYRLAHQSVKTLFSEFPESEYARKIAQEDVVVFKNTTGNPRKDDLVIYTTESVTSSNFEVHQKDYKDLPRELKQKFHRARLRSKGTFAAKSLQGTRKFRYEILALLRPQKLANLDDLETQSPARYSSALIRDELFDQNNLLFYFALKSLPISSILKNKDLAVLLVNFYLGFGLKDKAEQIIQRSPVSFSLDLAEICILNSYPALALNLLKNKMNRSSKARRLRIESVLQLGQLDNIEAELNQLKSPDRTRVTELWLDVISKKGMPVKTYIRYLNEWMDAKLEQMR